MRRTFAAVTAAAFALVVAAPAVAATPVFKGTVGPGFTISLTTKPTKAGKVVFTLNDKSSIHNFHLLAPGGKQVAATVKGKAVKKVDTGVGATGTTSITLTLKAGKYTFVCDPHASSMKGSFTVK